MGERLVLKLRHHIADKYFRLSFAAIKNVSPGLLSLMVGEDMKEAQQSFTRIINSFLKEGLCAVIFIFWLIFLDFHLFLLFLMVLIPAAFVLRATGKVLKKLSRQGLAGESDLLSGLLERMRGWQVIQSHRSLDYEIRHFNVMNNKIFHIWRRAARAKSLGSPLVEWLGIVAASVVIVLALRRLQNQELSQHILVS